MDNDRFVLPTTVRNRRDNKGAGRGLQAGLGCLVLLFLCLLLPLLVLSFCQINKIFFKDVFWFLF